jgi:hypothetical protein
VPCGAGASKRAKKAVATARVVDEEEEEEEAAHAKAVGEAGPSGEHDPPPQARTILNPTHKPKPGKVAQARRKGAHERG